ncbi:sugar ABC transporter substrate-binding protein [Tumebacillus sp. ITR2]|uniref:Sugar ABC transporter substrate-binding protein n=1 Tax=Tumebacillus amylolyticus TaxID=2801339 RepID=A0ABS1JEJ3_9BACL|nr:sugar ABC transporter substrate-binding protein [Tumebacillus amylolyticus]MBL0388620.1 sugar ABC transporter substrate-binding protein [Tumebacillus amylolyticus]
MNYTKYSKAFAVLATATLLTVAVTGCSKDSASTTKQETANWTGKITIWDGPRWEEAGNKYAWIESQKKAFETSHPGVTVEIVQVPWAELNDKLGVSIAGKAWPDLAPVDISGNGVNAAFLKQKVLEPIDEYVTADDKKDFLPNALDAYTQDGKLYGLPGGMTVHGMLLNLDIFKERNVEPPKDGKWTWDEFVDDMKKLTYDKDGDGKVDVYGLSTYVKNGYYESWPFLYMDGGRPVSDDLKTFTFDSKEATGAMKKLADLKTIPVAPKEMGSGDVGGTWKAFSAQKNVAVEPWATWAIQAAQKANMKNFMVAAYPTGSGKPVTIGGVGGWMMFHQDDAGKKKVIADLMKQLTSTEQQVVTAKNYSVFPSRKSAADQNPFADNPQMQQAQKLTETAVMMPKQADWKKIDEAIQSQLQLVLNGEKSPEDAMKEAKKTADELLSK